MILILMFALIIYGAILAADVDINKKYATSAFIVLGGMTFLSLLLWGIDVKIFHPPPAAVAAVAAVVGHH